MKHTHLMVGILSMLLLTMMMPLRAEARYGDPYYQYGQPPRQSVLSNPIVNRALIGAGIGAAVGGLTGARDQRMRRAVGGAVIGGTAGAAWGYVQRNNQMRHQPLPVYAPYTTGPYGGYGYRY